MQPAAWIDPNQCRAQHGVCVCVCEGQTRCCSHSLAFVVARRTKLEHRPKQSLAPCLIGDQHAAGSNHQRAVADAVASVVAVLALLRLAGSAEWRPGQVSEF